MPTDRQRDWECAIDRAMDRAYRIDTDSCFALLRAENRVLRRKLARARRFAWASLLVGLAIPIVGWVLWLAR